MTQQFFYDNQIRRFLLQFTRIFSNFQVEYGTDDAGNVVLQSIPIKYGDPSRQAVAAAQKNSASVLPSSPSMSFYISALEYERSRMQEPYHVNKMHVRQREWDPITQEYETTQGNAFTVERLMPVPYNMSVNLDIWTSNTNQKLQVFEQIATLFNPAMEIQSTDNFIDWTSLTTVELTRTNWTNRSIPMGTDETIDIMSMTFLIPIWLSPPAKVKKLGVVNKIVASVYDANGDARDAIFDEDLLLGTRQKFTPYGYQILLLDNQVQILDNNEPDINRNTLDVDGRESGQAFWKPVIEQFGELRSGISQLRIDNPFDNTEIIGTVAFHPTDDRFLLFTPDDDTLPANTLQPVDSVIDPTRSGPGVGLPTAATGQRYLLTDDIGDGDNDEAAAAWGDVIAKANDIVQYDGSEWQVSFDSANSSDVEFATNITTNIQYRWTGDKWLKSYQGLYAGGEWNIVL